MINVIADRLDAAKYHSLYFVECAFLEKTDAATRVVMDTLRFINPNFDADQVKLFLSDAAPYMIRAGKDLKLFFLNTIHVICLFHGFHRVCEMVREIFKEVNVRSDRHCEENLSQGSLPCRHMERDPSQSPSTPRACSHKMRNVARGCTLLRQKLRK